MNAPKRTKAVHHSLALLDLQNGADDAYDAVALRIASLAIDGAPASAEDVQALHVACTAYEARRDAVTEAAERERLAHVEAWRGYWGWVCLDSMGLTDVEPHMLRVHQQSAALVCRRAQASAVEHLADLQTALVDEFRCLSPKIWQLLEAVTTVTENAASSAAQNCTLQEIELSYLRHFVWGTEIGNDSYTLAPLDVDGE